MTKFNLPKRTEKKKQEMAAPVAVPATKEKFVGLSGFDARYSNNQAVPMVYFEDSTEPVSSPYTSLVNLSEKINNADQEFIDILDKGGMHKELLGVMRARRFSVITQFNNRVNFLSRSLALNINQKIIDGLDALKLHPWGIDVSEVEHIISINFIGVRMVQSEGSSAINNIQEYIKSYEFTSSNIPMIVSQVYDYYDSQVVQMISTRYGDKDGTHEELHMKYLQAIFPIFEMFKGQLEWLDYMLRNEARTIYRPMGMIDAEPILEANLCNKEDSDDGDESAQPVF
jgi:hypothetical protein